MPSILFGISSERAAGNFPPFVLENMFAEESASGVALLSRPGLQQVIEAGDGPVRAILSQDGSFSGDTFTISGSELYRQEELLGEVDGAGPASMAASGSELLVTGGASLYLYNAITLEKELFPDDANVAKVIDISGFFVAVRDDSQKYYWRVAGTTEWQPLNFASAEAKPDPLSDLGAINEILWLFGSETVEPWQLTGNADLPFQRIPNATFNKGVLSRGCVTPFDNSLVFVGNDHCVYRIDSSPKRISTHDIEERIEASDEVRCYSYTRHGHSFVAVRFSGGRELESGQVCPAGTALFDAATGRWTRFSSYGLDNFRAQCASYADRQTLLGDGESGKVFTFGGTTDDGDPVARIFTAAFPITGGKVAVDNLTVFMNVGHNRPVSGNGSDPVLEVRASADAGATWGAWRQMSIGRDGAYSVKARLTRFGMFGTPGAMFQFRLTDPVGLRVSDVRVNEPL